MSAHLWYLSLLALHLSSFSVISVWKSNLENTVGWGIPETHVLLSNFYSKPPPTCSLFQYYCYQFPASFFFVFSKVFADKTKNTSWSVTVLYYFSHFNCIYDELLNIIICFKFCRVLNQALPDINHC